MMGSTGITLVIAVCWLTGVVGAASLSPGDQYSPHQSPYRRNVAQGPLDYPNWLKYQQDLTTSLEPPIYTPDIRRPDINYFSRGQKAQKDSLIRNLDILHLVPEEWKVGSSAKIMRNSSRLAALNLGVPEDSDSISTSNDDEFVENDTFQDQGPGSVEVYQLDLHRENPLLVPHVNEKEIIMGSKMKSKIPKKVMAEEILWKLKSIETNKTPLPSIFQQPTSLYKGPIFPQDFSRTINEKPKDEVFAVGGVPELQVGCEGLEASNRQKRSTGSGIKNTYDDDWDNSHKYQDPVYKESTEPILLRVTPIVLDIEEEEPPSGEIYEEMDELLKLKKLESTSPKPTTKRWNRADIDPALAENKYQKELTKIETFPERGDLGPKSNGSGSEVKKSIDLENLKRGRLEKRRFRRDNFLKNAPALFHIDHEDEKYIPRSPVSQSEDHQGSRRLLWVQYPKSQEYQNQAANTRHHQAVNDNRNNPDLWGFGEDDGAISDSEQEPDVNDLRLAEVEKRRREYDRRRQEELNRRREGARRDHQPNSENLPSGGRDVNTEIERIRKEYERQLEVEQIERQRILEGRREGGQRRESEKDQWTIQETKRRQEEESRRRLEEEQRRNRDPSYLRRQQEEERRRDWNRRREEEERRRFENQQKHQEPPSPLMRVEPSNTRNITRSQEDREVEERKLRDYIERNRPINPNINRDHGRLDEQFRRNEHDERERYIQEQQRRQIEYERRRQQMEEHRRRQQQLEKTEMLHEMKENRTTQHQSDEDERRRQIEEYRKRKHQRDEDERSRQIEQHRRRQHQPDEDKGRRRLEEQRRQHQRDEEERRKQIEEQRRRNHPQNYAMEEERRRRLEEERKLQDYVRRNQPVIVPRRNNSQAFNSSQESDLQEQRRTIEAARQWDRNRRPVTRTNEGRIHGPSAPTNIGQRHSQDDLEEIRRRHEEERRRAMDRRIMEQEEHRREAEYQRAESRRREEQRIRLEEALRRDEKNRRAQLENQRNPWQDYGSARRPAIELPDQEAEELRRQEESRRTKDNEMRNREDQWRKSEERRRQQQQEEERERHRLENERNSRYNERRRPQYENNGPKSTQRGESARDGHEEWRRHEHARLNSLPVSARIILRSKGASQNHGTSPGKTLPIPPDPSVPSLDTRNNFNNDLDFPILSPHRPGLEASRFPASVTLNPPTKSPGACVWAIVQCCPVNDRLTRCFESMGCPGVNWDPNPCRGSLADAARAEVIKFYESADAGNTRF